MLACLLCSGNGSVGLKNNHKWLSLSYHDTLQLVDVPIRFLRRTDPSAVADESNVRSGILNRGVVATRQLSQGIVDGRVNSLRQLVMRKVRVHVREVVA